MTRKAFRITVFGRVQGVGFRYYTSEQANRLSLEGYVRNLNDGSVDIHVQGGEEKVQEFLKWCHSGPASARVDKLEYEAVDEIADEGFNIRR